MNRRHCLSLLTGAAAAALGAPGARAALGALDLASEAAPVWEAWKTAHLTSDGRVVDTFQEDGSHSEGQGYGMVLAAIFEDAPAFRRMFDWTELNLARRGDGLLSWRWLPGRSDPVPDRNNASDGDLFYGWALVRAGRSFAEPRHMTRAIEIAEALAATCIVTDPSDPDRTVLLPAVHGFAHDGRLTLNPSYYMPLAMRELADATGVQAIATCAAHGQALIDRVAAQGLVPDWIELDEDGWRPARLFPPQSGYEAIRVPLFQIWSGNAGAAAVRAMAAAHARAGDEPRLVPVVFEPDTGAVLERSPDPGYRALAGLVHCARSASVGAAIPAFDPDQPYYPATLQMFAMIAANEVLSECVPI